jgi:hypothetical protein
MGRQIDKESIKFGEAGTNPQHKNLFILYFMSPISRIVDLGVSDRQIG